MKGRQHNYCTYFILIYAAVQYSEQFPIDLYISSVQVPIYIFQEQKTEEESTERKKMKPWNVLNLLVTFFIFGKCDCSNENFIIGDMIWGVSLGEMYFGELYNVGLLTCAQECLTRQHCKSISYERSTTICRLSDTKLTNDQMESNEVNHSVYSDISTWPKVCFLNVRKLSVLLVILDRTYKYSKI